VQDNISLIPSLVFHLASTHLGRGTQQQIHWSVEGPRGSKTPTGIIWAVPPQFFWNVIRREMDVCKIFRLYELVGSHLRFESNMLFDVKSKFGMQVIV
jgi:hypothetical protein